MSVFVDVERDETEEGDKHECDLNSGSGKSILKSRAEEEGYRDEGGEGELCCDDAENFSNETAVVSRRVWGNNRIVRHFYE